MKILHIIDSGGLYGAEMVLLNLVAEQVKMGLDSTIASIGEKNIVEKPLETEALKRGFKVEKFQMRPGPNYPGALKILRFAHKEGFDLLHSHGYKGNILFGFMPKRIRRLPLVATLHGWTSTNGLTKMKLYQWLDKKSFKFIDAVALVSEAMKSHPKLKDGKGINLHVIHNGIPTADFLTHGTQSTQQTQATQRTEQTQTTQVTQVTQMLDPTIIDFCNGGYTIGSIGRLSKEKGYRYLIEAIDLLVKEGIDARLLIIGEGYERNLLNGLVEQFVLTDRVLMPGYKEDAKKYLPYFNLFVLSSLTEGLPITLLEAMQVNLPIVATKAGGIPEVLQNGKGGLLVESGRANPLAETISRLYHNPKLAKDLASASYQEAITKYTSKTMASGYLDIYQKLLRHNHSRFGSHAEQAK